MIFGNVARHTFNGNSDVEDPVVKDLPRLRGIEPLKLGRPYGRGRETPVNILPSRIKPIWFATTAVLVGLLAWSCHYSNNKTNIINGAKYDDKDTPLAEGIRDEVLDSKLGASDLIDKYKPLLSEKAIELIGGVEWVRGTSYDERWNDINYMLNRIGAISDIFKHHRDENGNFIELSEEAHENLFKALENLKSKGYLHEDIKDISVENIRKIMESIVRSNNLGDPDAVFSAPALRGRQNGAGVVSSRVNLFVSAPQGLKLIVALA